jgi:hypothetical protein
LVVFGAACIVFTAMGISQLRQTSRFGSLFPIAEKLESGSAISPELLSRYTALAGEISNENYCRSDIVMAGAAVVLEDLDHHDQDADYNAWADALSRGEKYFDHAIRCTPSNANYWLRLAMIRQATAERPDELASLMRRSVALAPADQDMIIARFPFWNRVSPGTLEAAKDAVESDIKIVLDDGNPFQIAPAIKGIGKNLAPYFREVAQSISPDKLRLYKKAGLDIASLPQ